MTFHPPWPGDPPWAYVENALRRAQAKRAKRTSAKKQERDEARPFEVVGTTDSGIALRDHGVGDIFVINRSEWPQFANQTVDGGFGPFPS